MTAMDFAIKRIEQLEQQLKIAVDALEHYAKGNAFGDTARQALEKIKGEKWN